MGGIGNPNIIFHNLLLNRVLFHLYIDIRVIFIWKIVYNFQLNYNYFTKIA